MNNVGLEATYATGGYVEPLLQSALGYAAGGQIPQGPGLQNIAPQPTPGGAPQAPDPHMDAMKLDSMVASNPQGTAKIREIIQQAVQSGQLDLQKAHLAVQLARAVQANPAMWPQLRAYAVRQGLAGPNDLPQQYDQSIVNAILLAAKAAEDMLSQQGGQPGGASQGAPAPGGQQQLATGGAIIGPGTGTSDSIHTQNRATGQPVSVSSGEYVIPAHVVQIKGKEFFDNLLRKYHTPQTNANS